MFTVNMRTPSLLTILKFLKMSICQTVNVSLSCWICGVIRPVCLSSVIIVNIANSVFPDVVAFDLGLHCLLRLLPQYIGLLW